MIDLSLKDKQLLNIVQSTFPLAARPYAEMGKQLEVSEDEIIEHIGDLKRRHIIRQISAIFDTRKLGENLDRNFSRQSVTTIKEGMALIQSPLTDLDVEDERLYQAMFHIEVEGAIPGNLTLSLRAGVHGGRLRKLAGKVSKPGRKMVMIVSSSG